MPEFFAISTKDKNKWETILNAIGDFDFYHLPGYHELHEQQGEGQAVLLVYSDGLKLAALPLIIRDIHKVKGLEDFQGIRDATSVYGYPGPLANSRAKESDDFIEGFHIALERYAHENNLVSIFSRLNPLLENQILLKGLGDTVKLSKTISINLSLDEEKQLAQYRKSHRYEIRRAKKQGMTVERDADWSYYGEFIELYYETMKRVNASENYFFDHNYFSMLKSALGDRLHLFVARINDEICGASLFVHTNDIIQYHLSATNEDYKFLAPSKLIIDEVRQWGSEAGAKWLHLGGGVGSNEDALFKFKAGFSKHRHPFYIWKWIVKSNTYEKLTKSRRAWRRAEGLSASENGFFPSYRI